MYGTEINRNFGGAFTSIMLGGGIALMITGGLISKDVMGVGRNLIQGGVVLVVISVVWYFISILILYVKDVTKK
jgi:hypothetical protein